MQCFAAVNVPVTLKFRTGCASSRTRCNWLNSLRRAESGANVHGRTRSVVSPAGRVSTSRRPSVRQDPVIANGISIRRRSAFVLRKPLRMRNDWQTGRASVDFRDTVITCARLAFCLRQSGEVPALSRSDDHYQFYGDVVVRTGGSQASWSHGSLMVADVLRANDERDCAERQRLSMIFCRL